MAKLAEQAERYDEMVRRCLSLLLVLMDWSCCGGQCEGALGGCVAAMARSRAAQLAAGPGLTGSAALPAAAYLARRVGC